MYYIYTITLPKNEIYVGCTKNLKRRAWQHCDNIRVGKNKFAKYVHDNYKDFKLKVKDLSVKASFEDRNEALKYERALTKKYVKLSNNNLYFLVLNDNYNVDCSRKGKNIGNTAKKYVLVDYIEHTTQEIFDLRQYGEKMGVDYRTFHSSLKGLHTTQNRYKLFYENQWNDFTKKEQEYFLSGNFLEDRETKIRENKQKKYSKTYKVRCPNGDIVIVKNLDKFARENNLTCGTLHATIIKNKPTKGYQVIERI